MSFIELDTSRAAHILARLQSAAQVRADALFERVETRRRWWSSGTAPDQCGDFSVPEGTVSSPSVRREEGLAVRLVSAQRSWIESRDGCTSFDFEQAQRRVARSSPTVPLPPLELETKPWINRPAKILDGLPAKIESALRELRVAFSFSLEMIEHRRELLLIGPDLLSEPQLEHFLSVRVDMGGIRLGSLYPIAGADARFDAQALDLAATMADAFRSRDAQPPPWGTYDVVFSPQATAILLHEAVAHALEVDLLELSGSVEGAIGVQLGSQLLDVLDDPSSAPTGVRRTHDDEGSPSIRRWLLREGAVHQPLADLSWSLRSALVDPGAGRRATRHDTPGPRSYFLELLAGDSSRSDLLHGRGLWIDRIDRARLAPVSGEIELRIASGRRFDSGTFSDRLGPFSIRVHLAEALSQVVAVGSEARAGGAGWCAKDGQRLPVWAQCPSLRVERLIVSAQ